MFRHRKQRRRQSNCEKPASATAATDSICLKVCACWCSGWQYICKLIFKHRGFAQRRSRAVVDAVIGGVKKMAEVFRASVNPLLVRRGGCAINRNVAKLLIWRRRGGRPQTV